MDIDVEQQLALCNEMLDLCDRTAQNSSVLSPKPVRVVIKQ
jgi:hypothetical protein